MRAIPARKCSKFTYGPDEQMGVVRYDQKMADLPRPPDPLSEPPLYSISCADEPYAKLKPWVPWTVEDPFNIGMACLLAYAYELLTKLKMLHGERTKTSQTTKSTFSTSA